MNQEANFVASPSKTHRWVIEAPNTSNAYVRELYEKLPGQWWETKSAKPGQQIFEGSAQDLEATKQKVASQARSRCGFCDGPKPCLRDD